MKLKSWDGHAINDGANYNAAWGAFAPHGLPAVTGITNPRSGAWPVLSSITRPGRVLSFTVYIRTGGSAAELAAWFDPEDETARQLIVENAAGGNDRYVMAICEQMDEVPFNAGKAYRVSLRVDGDVRWRKVTSTSVTRTYLSSGATATFTNNGQDKAFPVIEYNPQAVRSSGGFTKRRFVRVDWGFDVPVANYPVDIVDDKFDTAAEVIAGNMQADGDDLRVFVDGGEVDRWLDGINTTTTRVWCNLDFVVAPTMTLDGGISAINTTLKVDADISDMPSEGILLIGSELIYYQSKSDSAKEFRDLVRGTRGTSAALHSTGATVKWIQHDIWIYYGDSSLPAPNLNGDYKPMFNLSTSTNGSWDYDDFYETGKSRPGSWTPKIIWGSQSFRFYGGNRGATAEPYGELGITNYGTNYQNTASWEVYHPLGITAANFVNGEKAEGSITGVNWKAEIISRKSYQSTSYTIEYSIPAPASSGWYSWSRNETLDTGSVSVGILLTTTGNPGELDGDYVECSDVTLTLAGSPSTNFSAADDIYQVEATISNNTTGDQIRLAAYLETNSLPTSDVLVIDTDQKSVYINDSFGNQIQSAMEALTLLGDVRNEWLPLQPGNNTIEVVEAGLTDIDLKMTWEERSYS